MLTEKVSDSRCPEVSHTLTLTQLNDKKPGGVRGNSEGSGLRGRALVGVAMLEICQCDLVVEYVDLYCVM